MRRLADIFSISFILSFVALSVRGQDDFHVEGLPYNIPTPTAYSLGKFGTVPVSPYTGTANIMIPVFSTVQRGLPLEVNLQYDTSGFLVNTLPAWTGHGWSLNAGGMITRQVCNYEDELDQSSYDGRWLYFRNYFTCHTHNTNDTISQLTSEVQQNMYSPHAYNMANINQDYAPDIFHFNFMGITGRFFLGSDGQWKVHSDHNIDVVFDYTNADNLLDPIFPAFSTDNGIKQLPKTIKGFTLIDENGYVYEFGGSTDAIEYSTDMMKTRQGVDQPRWTADTWMLTRVKDRFGNTLYTFSYSRGKYIVQIANSIFDEIYQSDNSSGFIDITYHSYRLNTPVYLDNITAWDGTKILFDRESAFPDSVASRILYPSCYGNQNLFIIEHPYTSSHNRSNAFFYLQSHTSPYSDLQANPDVDKNNDPLSSMDMALLKKISVVASVDTLRSYDLHYSYNSRIHLDSVSISTDNDKIGVYSLQYHSFSSLPADYLTKCFDHWGYYNSNNNFSEGQTSEPYNPILEEPYSTGDSTYINTNYLMPDASASMCGMLYVIQYPTGGCTVLTYEQNTYSKHLSDDRQQVVAESWNNNAGGLRIKTICDYEDITMQKMLSKREYYYSCSLNGISSGELFAVPNSTCVWDNHLIGTNEHCDIETAMLASVIPLSNSFGPHIGYSDVIEENTNGDYVKYHYSNMSDFHDEQCVASAMNCITSSWTPYDCFSERGYMRGKLLSQKHYTSSNQMVRETSYTYNDDATFNSERYVWTHNMDIHNFSGGNSCFVGGIYKLYYPKISITSRVEKTLMGNTWVTDSTEYDYADYSANIEYQYSHSALFRKCLRDAIYRRNDVVSHNYQYATGDALPLDCHPGIIESELEILNDTTLYNHSYHTPLLSVSTYHNGDFIQEQRTVYNLFGNHYLPALELLFIGNQYQADTVMRYDQYTDKEQLAQYTDGQGIRTCLKWDNNDRLLATAANMSGLWRTIHRLSLPDSITSSVSGEFFGSKPVNVNIYEYNTAGLPMKIKQGNSQTISYEYNSFGGLRNIIDIHGDVTAYYIYKYRTGDLINSVKPFTNSNGLILDP